MSSKDQMLRPVKLGLELGKVGWYFFEELGGMTLSAIVKPPDVVNLQSQQLLHDAEMGLKAVVRGRDEADPRLEHEGRAMMVRALVKTSDPESPGVTGSGRAISRLISESGVKVEPTTLIPEDVAQSAAELVAMSARVVDLHPKQ